MRRALRRAAQVFVAAGALGLVSPALAQSSHPVGKSVPASATHSVAAEPTVLNAADEMQVELAWLADRATFPYNLSAHVVGGEMEVQGFVPNVTLRELAIRVATKHTMLPVVDKLQINANVGIPIGGGSAAELTEKATALLTDDLGDQAKGVEVTARDNGVITVKGVVSSPEDRLAVSRKMRLVDGCSAVVNQLTVASVSAGMPAPTVAVAPPPAPWQPPTMAAPTTKPAPTTVGTPQYAAGATAPMPLPLAKVPDTIDTKSPVVVDKKTPSSAWAQMPAAAKVDTATPVTAAPVPPKANPSWATDTVAMAKPPANNGKWPAAFQEKTQLVAYVTTGVVTFDDDLSQPLPKATPTPTKAPYTPGAMPAASATEPMKPTTIMATGGADPFAPVPTSQAAKLKHDVEAVCGKQAREVQVLVKEDKLLHVVVKAEDDKSADALLNKILQMPEMATPNVKLDMQVGK